MTSVTVAVVLLGAAFILLLVRRTRGTGRAAAAAAQREFKRHHGDRVAALLAPADHASPQLRNSPWMDVELGGRPARMVAARIETGRLQAGIELAYWWLGELQIWHTSGEPGELEMPDEHPLEVAQIEAIVAQLGALGVDSISAPTMRAPHLLRVQFDDLDGLAATIAAIGPLLAQLESPPPPDPDGSRAK